jgi:hypothetical protein
LSSEGLWLRGDRGGSLPIPLWTVEPLREESLLCETSLRVEEADAGSVSEREFEKGRVSLACAGPDGGFLSVEEVMSTSIASGCLSDVALLSLAPFEASLFLLSGLTLLTTSGLGILTMRKIVVQNRAHMPVETK